MKTTPITPAKLSEQEIQDFKKSAEIGGSGAYGFSQVRRLIGHILALEAERLSKVTIVFAERNDEQRVIKGVFSNEHEALKCVVASRDGDFADGVNFFSRQYEVQDKYIPEE